MFLFSNKIYLRKKYTGVFSSYVGQRNQVAYPSYGVPINLFAQQCGCLKSSRHWNVSCALRNERFYGYYEYEIACISRRIK
jgi:hypothetical protein